MKHFSLWLMAACFLAVLSACNREQGCTDALANNFNPDAKVENNTCEYDVDATPEMLEVQEASSDLTGAFEEDLQLFTYGDYEMGNNSNLRNADSPLPLCASLSIDSTAGPGMYPATLHVDFGSSNCLCEDGKTRRGRLHYYISNSWLTLAGNDTMRVYLDNYYVNDQAVTGTRVYIKDNGQIIAGDIEIGMKFFVENASYETASGTHLWDYEGRINLDINALNTYTDNIFTVTIDGGTYTSPDGKDFVFATASNEPLVAGMDCISNCLFTDGTLTMQRTYPQTMSLGSTSNLVIQVTNTANAHFGDGICDDSLDIDLSSIGVRNSSSGLIIYSENMDTSVICSQYSTID